MGAFTTGRIAIVVLVAALTAGTSQARNPCGPGQTNALVMSGGGLKGPFETGADYQLIVLRGCDVQEISGNSVGGLIAAFLAQARADADPGASQKALANQTEDLVRLWESLRSSRDIYKSRTFGKMGPLLGKDSFYDFTPLRRLIESNISLERL